MANAVRWSPEQLETYRRKQALETRPPLQAVPNKHGAITTHRGELRFDSKHEAVVWDALQMRQKAGDIDKLQRQVTFVFTVLGVRIGHFRADFFYRTTDGVWKVADAKSAHTRALNGWARTRHLLKACYGFDVEEL